MKKLLFVALIGLFSSCTDDEAFIKGKKQLEQQGYTDVKNTGYSAFCCGEKDTFSTGFSCKNSKGETVKGCFCSGIFKGLTIRFE